VNDSGYKLPKLTARRVLDTKTKKKRVTYAEARLHHLAAFWARRAYGDAHWWHLPRTVAELVASRGATKGRVYRKPSEKDDPRFHGGKTKGVYKQGERVGVFGIMADGKLHVGWFDGGKCSAKSVAAVFKRCGSAWGVEKGFLVLDGERALHAEPAASAIKDLKLEVRDRRPLHLVLRFARYWRLCRAGGADPAELSGLEPDRECLVPA